MQSWIIAGEQSQAASLITPLQGSGVRQTPSPAPPKATALAAGSQTKGRLQQCWAGCWIMQAAWMFRLLVRYVQLLYTNVEQLC